MFSLGVLFSPKKDFFGTTLLCSDVYVKIYEVRFKYILEYFKIKGVYNNGYAFNCERKIKMFSVDYGIRSFVLN